MEPIVRLSRPDDLNTLKDLDLKCFDYPLEMAEWQELINGSGQDEKARVSVVLVQRKAVGFAVWKLVEEKKPAEAGEDPDHKFVIDIVRLGVREPWRRNKLGTLLLADIEDDAKRRQADVLRITVPEIHCQPEGRRDKDDVTGFLNATHFKPTGKVVTDFCKMYGDLIDGYVWERTVL